MNHWIKKEVPTHIPHFPHVTFDPGPPAKWVTPMTRSSEVPTHGGGTEEKRRRPRGEPRKLREESAMGEGFSAKDGGPTGYPLK